MAPGAGEADAAGVEYRRIARAQEPTGRGAGPLAAVRREAGEQPLEVVGCELGVGIQGQKPGRRARPEGDVHPAREAGVLAELENADRDPGGRVAARRRRRAVAARAVDDHDLERPVALASDGGEARRQIDGIVVGDDRHGDRRGHRDASSPNRGKPASAARATWIRPAAAWTRVAARAGLRSGSRASRASAPNGTSARNERAQPAP